MTKKPSKARKVLDKPQIVGWRTSDDDEIRMRQWRGRAEIASIEALEPNSGPYGAFRVRSATGGVYDVEIRDLVGRLNSCGCADHRVNGLGTCKHIEGALAALKKKGVRAFKAAAGQGSPRTEIFIRRDGDPTVTLFGSLPSAEAGAFLDPFLDEKGALTSDPDALARLVEAAPGAPAGVRVSRHLKPWIERARLLTARDTARRKFLAAAGPDGAGFDVVKLPLLPYRRNRVSHGPVWSRLGLSSLGFFCVRCHLGSPRTGSIRRQMMEKIRSVPSFFHTQDQRLCILSHHAKRHSPKEPAYRPDEVASLHGVLPETIDRAIHAGLLPPHQDREIPPHRGRPSALGGGRIARPGA